MKKSKIIFIACAVLFLCIHVAGAAPKGKVVVGLNTNIVTMDPHMHNVQINYYPNWATYDHLVSFNSKTLEIEPVLAESWKIIDENTWEFKLRKNVKFHNGNSFNAEVVKFNLERVLRPEQKSRFRGAFKPITKIEVVDDYIIRLITQKPYPVLLARLTNFPMVDPVYLKEKGDQGLAKIPMGTGAYKFVEWVKGQRLVLEANEDYWREVPEVKTIIFRPIPEMATQIAELLSGGVDLIRNVPPDQVEIINSSKVAAVSSVPGLRTLYLQLDIDANAGKGPVQNLKFRQALNHAINTDAIVKHIMSGMAKKTITGVNPMVFGYDGNIQEHYPYDPQKAKALLKEAGYENGATITVNSYSGSVIAVKQIVEAISGDLAKIGVTVKNHHFGDTGTYVKAFISKKCKDAILGSWAYATIYDADMWLYPHFRSGQRFCLLTDPKLDEYLDGARSTLDKAQRQKFYSSAQDHIMKNAYIVPLYAQPIVYGISKRISFEPSADDIIKVYNIKWNK